MVFLCLFLLVGATSSAALAFDADHALPRTAADSNSERSTPAFAATTTMETAKVAAKFAAQSLATDFFLEPLKKNKERYHYFHAGDAEQEWFIKVAKDGHTVVTPEELAWARWAADHNFGPQVHPLSGTDEFPATMAARWLPGETLSYVAASDRTVQANIMHALRRLHASGDAPANVPTPQYAGAAWERLAAMERKCPSHPLSFVALCRSLAEVERALFAEHWPQTVCHRDTQPANIFSSEDQIVLIDWEYAGWDDPYRDVARYLVLSWAPYADVPRIVQDYLLRMPTPSEMRHLFRLMLLTEIDFYAAPAHYNSCNSPSIARRARRIVQCEQALQSYSCSADWTSE